MVFDDTVIVCEAKRRMGVVVYRVQNKSRVHSANIIIFTGAKLLYTIQTYT